MKVGFDVVIKLLERHNALSSSRLKK